MFNLLFNDKIDSFIYITNNIILCRNLLVFIYKHNYITYNSPQITRFLNKIDKRSVYKFLYNIINNEYDYQLVNKIILISNNQIKINKKELIDSVKAMQNNKACGIDDMVSEIFKTIIGNSQICDIFLSVLNICYHSKTVPNEWHASLLIPIFKKGVNQSSSFINFVPAADVLKPVFLSF